MKPIIAIVGPTATGKTGLSVQLALELGVDIISADSRIVYQQMDIGTAKPTAVERQGVPHYLIDCAKPTEAFSAASYQQLANPLLEERLNQENPPLVVGGTGFYLKALLQETFIPDVPPDEAFRQALLQQAERQPADYLYERLKVQDPLRAQALHPNDHVRIIRALEIIHSTGQPVPQQANKKDLNIVWVGLTYADRTRLDQQIDNRIEQMLIQGWIEEVEMLMHAYGEEAHALQITHGYPEWMAYIQGKLSYQEALVSIQTQIHQYSRRQLTWFRRNKDIQWYPVDEMDRDTIQTDILKRIEG